MKESVPYSSSWFIRIFCVVILSSVANLIPCNSFPKILGGSSGDSTVHQIDVFEDFIAYGGGTNDITLTTFATNLPVILLASISMNYYYWTKAFIKI